MLVRFPSTKLTFWQISWQVTKIKKTNNERNNKLSVNLTKMDSDFNENFS